MLSRGQEPLGYTTSIRCVHKNMRPFRWNLKWPLTTLLGPSLTWCEPRTRSPSNVPNATKLDRSGLILHYRPGGPRDRLGPLEKRILSLLLEGPLHGAHPDHLNIYSSAGLSIKPRSAVTKIDMLKEMIRAWGLEPEKILTRETPAEPHRAYASSEEREQEEMRLLGFALKDSLKKELLACFSQTLRNKK
jgi:hypothetical protein